MNPDYHGSHVGLDLPWLASRHFTGRCWSLRDGFPKPGGAETGKPIYYSSQRMPYARDRSVSLCFGGESHDELMTSGLRYCMVGPTEYRILATGTATSDLPSSYTDCHAHATETQVQPLLTPLRASLSNSFCLGGA